METKNMLYIVSEYANQGEIFGKLFFIYKCFIIYAIPTQYKIDLVISTIFYCVYFRLYSTLWQNE